MANELYHVRPEMKTIEAVAGGTIYFNRPVKPDSASITTMVAKERLYAVQDTSATSKNCIGIAYPARGMNEEYAFDSGGWYAVAGQRILIVQPGSNCHVRVGTSWAAGTDPLGTIHASGVQAQGGTTNMTLCRALIPTTYAAGDYAFCEILCDTGLTHNYTTKAFATDGAIDIVEGVAELSKSASAGAYTLAQPTAGTGKILVLVSSTARAHVVTLGSGTWGNGGTNNKITFGGAKGDSAVIVEYGAYWYIISLHNATEGA